jgi:hypothetical protein
VDKLGVLQKAQTLLQQMVDSRDAPIMVVLHHLRDLAIALDELSLSAECILVGNCALSLIRAASPWLLDLQQEMAENLALIAQLSPYQRYADTLLWQAISPCEEVVVKDGCESSKKSLPDCAESSSEPPSLGIQRLGEAIGIMTTELLSTVDHIGNSIPQLIIHLGSHGMDWAWTTLQSMGVGNP